MALTVPFLHKLSIEFAICADGSELVQILPSNADNDEMDEVNLGVLRGW